MLKGAMLIDTMISAPQCNVKKYSLVQHFSATLRSTVDPTRVECKIGTVCITEHDNMLPHIATQGSIYCY